jgi:hypothetical protein
VEVSKRIPIDFDLKFELLMYG